MMSFWCNLCFCIEKAEADELSVQVDEACALLTDYNKQLAAELEERKRLAKLVRSFIKSQKDIIHKSEEQLVVGVLI